MPTDTKTAGSQFASASELALVAASVQQLQSAFAASQGFGLGLGLGLGSGSGAAGKSAIPPAVAAGGSGSGGGGGGGSGPTDPLAPAHDGEPPKVQEIEYRIRAKAAKEVDPLRLGSGVSTAVQLAVPQSLAAQYAQDAAKEAPGRYADIRLALVKAANEYALRTRIDKVCAAAYEQSAKAAKREAQAFAEKVLKLDAAYERYVKAISKAPGNALRTDFFADFALPAYAHVAVDAGDAATVAALQWVAAHSGGGGGGSAGAGAGGGNPPPSVEAHKLQLQLLGDALKAMSVADSAGLAALLAPLGFGPSAPPAGSGSGSGSGAGAGAGSGSGGGSTGGGGGQPADEKVSGAAPGKSTGSDAD